MTLHLKMFTQSTEWPIAIKKAESTQETDLDCLQVIMLSYL